MLSRSIWKLSNLNLSSKYAFLLVCLRIHITEKTWAWLYHFQIYYRSFDTTNEHRNVFSYLQSSYWNKQFEDHMNYDIHFSSSSVHFCCVQPQTSKGRQCHVQHEMCVALIRENLNHTLSQFSHIRFECQLWFSSGNETEINSLFLLSTYRQMDKKNMK